MKHGACEYFIQTSLVVSTAPIVKTFNELIPQNVTRNSGKILNDEALIEYMNSLP